MTFYRTGLLLIRAWVEKGSPSPLRAHIRATSDVSKGFERELTVSDVPAASATVEAWLGDVMAEGQAEADKEIDEENVPDNLEIQRLGKPAGRVQHGGARDRPR